MKIDIIDLTDPKYADLSPVQLSMVRAAQSKKDKIVEELNTAVNGMYELLLANWNGRSSAYERETSVLQSKADNDVDAVREDLLYQLAYESIGSEGNENGPYRYPENPNYSLAYSQRFLVVRKYYMDVTTNPQARLEAYGMDTLARAYLGEFYQTLYDMLASYC